MSGVPLLFTSPQEQPAFDYTRGRGGGAGGPYDGLTPPSSQQQQGFGGGGGGGGGGLGTGGAGGGTGGTARRRSLGATATPGSVGTAGAAADPSPLRPPPIMRLQDALMSDGDLPGAAAGGGPSSSAAAAAAAAAASSGFMRVEAPPGAGPQAEDGWVTVFGFQPDDLPSMLRMFQECGDILQWSGGGGGGGGGWAGAGGGGANTNYANLLFATREGAQRALLRSGSMLRPGLIVGVKPLDARQRAMVLGGGGGGGGGATPLRAGGQQLGLAAAAQQRPYRVVTAALGGEGAASALPQPTRSWAQKFSEFVLGA
jgi:hypothetical protein